MSKYFLSGDDLICFRKECEAVTLRLKRSGYDLNKIRIVGEVETDDSGTDQGNS